MSSRRITDGAIAAAYKNDMQAGTLHGADEYSVRINSTWVLKSEKLTRLKYAGFDVFYARCDD